MQNNNRHILLAGNLIGDEQHKSFLQLQASYAIEKRGGSLLSGLTLKHAARLVNDLNLLSQAETHELIFSNYFFTTLS